MLSVSRMMVPGGKVFGCVMYGKRPEVKLGLGCDGLELVEVVGIVFCCLGLGVINSEKAFLFRESEEVESLLLGLPEVRLAGSLEEEEVIVFSLSDEMAAERMV